MRVHATGNAGKVVSFTHRKCSFRVLSRVSSTERAQK